MAIQLISAKCPNCGQTLSVDMNCKNVNCTSCGSKLLLLNENEFTFRLIDEGSIQKTYAERQVKLKELEIQEKREMQGQSLIKKLTVVWVIVSIAIIGLIVFKMMNADDAENVGIPLLLYIGVPVIGGGAYLVFKWLPDRENERLIAQKSGIRFPDGLAPFTEKKYIPVKEALRTAGFTNISCINLHDLNFLTVLISGDMIASVTVDGKPISDGGGIYMPNASIVITYHGR